MKLINNIYTICLIGLFCLGMVGCNDADVMPNPSTGDNLTVNGSLIIPDLSTVMSRGSFGDTPKSGLKLTILEFSLGADAANSFLTNVYQAEIKTTSMTVNGGVVDFKFNVNASVSPKILHLMVADDFVSPQFGSVATILPALTVGGQSAAGSEAYWGQVEFPDGMIEIDENGTATLLDDVSEKLTKVPMIRNFVKISVSENLPNFELLGFDVINAPMSGSIAPWDQNKLEVPQLLDGSSMKPYSDIDYSGNLPGNALLRNTEAQARSWSASDNMLNSGVRYMYEHPYEPARRTYLIIYGNYITGTIRTAGFYKVDIGYWDDGVFKYYNLLRNIHYRISITSVSAPGKATVSEAIDSSPFNNLSASTETSDMLSVSDGVNLLTVGDTNHIIVDDNQEIEVLYRYVENIGTSDESLSNDVAHPVNLIAGPDLVIKSFTETPVAYTDKYGTQWNKITILCNNPTIDVRTQQFQIIDGSGLSRTITLTLRRPWQYAFLKDRNGDVSDYKVTVINKATRTLTYTQLQPVPQTISSAAAAPLTVFFCLPPGLPSTMFPLDFRIEARKQGIENNKNDNLVVYTGPSLFDPDVLAISYIKTVTYNEYAFLYDSDTATSVNVNKTNENHIIACRFQTINAVTPGSLGEIMIYNEYFRPNVSVEFKRQ